MQVEEELDTQARKKKQDMDDERAGLRKKIEGAYKVIDTVWLENPDICSVGATSWLGIQSLAVIINRVSGLVLADMRVSNDYKATSCLLNDLIQFVYCYLGETCLVKDEVL